MVTIPRHIFAPMEGFARITICALALLLLAAPRGLDVDSIRNASAQPIPAELSRQLSSMTVQGDALLEANVATAERRNAAIPFASRNSDVMTPFRAISSTDPNFSTALACLTEAIYYEAANESAAGKRSVAQVILNRVRHPAYPRTVCGVIYQGYADPVCQFSYTCDGSLARRPLDRQWRESRDVARAALAGHVERSVGTATHYHADYVLPYWAFNLEKIHQEGTHIFYRLPGSAGRSGNFAARWNGREFRPAFDPTRYLNADLDDAIDTGGIPLSPEFRRDPTDRRADNDIGGRMDPSTGWQLEIPDPTAASDGYRAALDEQARNNPPASQPPPANGAQQ